MNRPIKEYITGPIIRLLDIVATNGFPLKVRVIAHRLKGVNIGKNTFIGKSVYLDNKKPDLISIGDNVGLAMGCVLLVHRRDIKEYSIDKGYNDYPFYESKVSIEDNCQIGVNAIIMPGVTIGRSSIIGAGSVVTKNIPPNSLAAGVPAKVIKSLS